MCPGAKAAGTVAPRLASSAARAEVGYVGALISRTRIILDKTSKVIGQWRPGSADITINRLLVKEAAQRAGNTVAKELYTTAYHEAFHRGFYMVDRFVSRLLGVNDIYSASKQAYLFGIGRGRWYRFEEGAAELYGLVRTYLRATLGIK